MTNWYDYLASLRNHYAQWWNAYTLTDVVGQQRVEQKQSLLLLDFTVETLRTAKDERSATQEKIERLDVLAGLRKYAKEHVLLVGRPGSGKSTALARLLLEEAEKPLPQPLPEAERGVHSPFSLVPEAERGVHSPPSLVPEAERGVHSPPSLVGKGAGGLGQTPVLEEAERGVNSPPSLVGKGVGGLSQIPVLVELRYYQTSVLDLIRDFLKRHRLLLDTETIEQLLYNGQLLLLIDGINELPSEAARRDLYKFRQDYQNTTPMIFT